MRRVTISTASFERVEVDNGGIEHACAMVRKALPLKPDLVLLPENFANRIGSPEEVPGRICRPLAEIARENHCYVVVPLTQQDGGVVYNSAVLFDRRGEVAGIYHKMFPTDNEIACGVTPGSGAVAFDTDFGRIGVAICFDLNFEELRAEYAALGIELLLFASAYEGGRQLQGWALDSSFYIVSSHRGGVGYFIDKTGHVLERSNNWCHPVMTRTLNMNRYVFHTDYNAPHLDDIRAEYGSAISIDADVPEGRFALESLREGLDVLAIKEEHGLEFFQEYLTRSRQVRRQALTDRAGIAQYLRTDRPS